jgi:antitoxin component of MazEF toxin-antitoxin module
MIQQKLRKVGNSYVVTVPREEIERLGIVEGQLVEVQLTPLEVRHVMSPQIREAFERSWARSEHAYRYLTDR